MYTVGCRRAPLIAKACPLIPCRGDVLLEHARKKGVGEHALHYGKAYAMMSSQLGGAKTHALLVCAPLPFGRDGGMAETWPLICPLSDQ